MGSHLSDTAAHSHGQLHASQGGSGGSCDGPSKGGCVRRGNLQKSSNKRRASPQEALRLQNPLKGSHGCCPFDSKLCSASPGVGALLTVEDLVSHLTTSFPLSAVGGRAAALL